MKFTFNQTLNSVTSEEDRKKTVLMLGMLYKWNGIAWEVKGFIAIVIWSRTLNTILKRQVARAQLHDITVPEHWKTLYVMPTIVSNPCKTSQGNRVQVKYMVWGGSPVEIGQLCSILNSPVRYRSFDCKLVYGEHVDKHPYKSSRYKRMLGDALRLWHFETSGQVLSQSEDHSVWQSNIRNQNDDFLLPLPFSLFFLPDEDVN